MGSKKQKPTPSASEALAACAKASKTTWAKAMKTLHTLDDAAIAASVDVEPVRRIVREATDEEVVRSAVYWLGRVGANAAPAALDIANALPRSANPSQSAGVLVALAPKLTAALRDALRAHLESDRSAVAKAAQNALKKLGDTPPEIPIERRIERVREELRSKSFDARWSGIVEAKRLGSAAHALIEPLRELGNRAARKKSIDAKVELDGVREALVAMGCKPEDLPRPPSRLEAYQGNTPRELGMRGGYAIASIDSRRSHGAVSVPTQSLGLWNHKTGKLLFVAEGAEVLDVIPKKKQAAIVRTSLRPNAKSGGTSRGDYTWTFERLAIPSGERVACLELPQRWTAGWPSSLVVDGDKAKLRIGDEDAPFTATIRISDDDGDSVASPRKSARGSRRKL